jgi:hypothetical protein
MRHHGVHITTDHATWPLAREGVGGQLADTGRHHTAGQAWRRRQLGAALKRHGSIAVIEAKNAVIIRAGDKPKLCRNRGEDLPEMKAVYHAIKDVLDQVLDFSPLPVSLNRNENAEKTARWLRRFNDERRHPPEIAPPVVLSGRPHRSVAVRPGRAWRIDMASAASAVFAPSRIWAPT